MRTGIGVVLTVYSFVVGFAAPFFAPAERTFPVITVEHRLPLRSEEPIARNSFVTAKPTRSERVENSCTDGEYGCEETRVRTIEEIERVQHLLVEDAKLIIAARRAREREAAKIKKEAARIESRSVEAKQENLKLLRSTHSHLNAHGQDIFPNITRALRKTRSAVELLDKSAKAAAAGDVDASHLYYKSAKTTIARAKRIAARRTIGAPAEWAIEPLPTD